MIWNYTCEMKGVLMFQVSYKVEAESIFDQKLAIWLAEQFQTNIGEQIEESLLDRCHKTQKWGNEFKKNCPESLEKSLFYICDSSTNYPNQNYINCTSLFYIWPLFFEKFPLGQIWLPKISQRWWDEIWEGEKQIAHKTGYDQKHPEGFHPQEASGLQAEIFPLTALHMLAYGIYPLVLCSYVHTTSDLVFIYLPDRAFQHSQMIDGRTLYQKTLWSVHHVFDDQWTFDSSRGPKSAADTTRLNPIKQLNYFDWFISKVNDRMYDIIDISDPFTREQLGMTINRAILDAQLCVTSQLPYMSKVFFFNCLDKLANLMVLLEFETDETRAWMRLVDKQFLGDEVLSTLKDIPDKAGEYLRWLIENALEEMRLDALLPQDLRDIRNSHHGYKLHSFNRLMEKTGEINNDITLIVTPLILFFLSKKWNIKK